MPRAFCFVLIPPGGPRDVGGVRVDFDALYREVLEPTVRDAGMEPVRSGIEDGGAFSEGLLLSEYAIVDLGAATATTFYQLGLREGLRRGGVGAVLIYPRGASLQGDTPPSEVFLYSVLATGAPESVSAARRDLRARLEHSAGRSNESTLLEIVERPPIPEVDHTVTDVFRDRVDYSARWKARLREARESEDALDKLRSVEHELDVQTVEAAVVIDLLLSYRAYRGWSDMIDLVGRMAKPLAGTTMVQEQYAFALNRAGKQERAIEILKDVISRRGASSETCALLGRVYKDQWLAAHKSGDSALAKSRLEAAVQAYLQGFEADWRDAFPGINAAMLMEVMEPPDVRQNTILPVVIYSAQRRIDSGRADYWDYATLIEAAVLMKNRRDAEAAFEKARALAREPWEPETTARNLRLIAEARNAREEAYGWADSIQEKLETLTIRH